MNKFRELIIWNEKRNTLATVVLGKSKLADTMYVVWRSDDKMLYGYSLHKGFSSLLENGWEVIGEL